MARTPFASTTSISFSSRPGSSAVTFTSLSVSLTSMFGQPTDQSNKRPLPNGARSKPRNTSSNSRFISRCRARTGLTSSPRRTLSSRPRLLVQGIRSLSAMVVSPYLCVRLFADLAKAPPSARGTGLSACKPVCVQASGGCLVLDGLVIVAGAVDRDLARLHRLRHFAHQVDLEQSVLEGGVLHLDVVGQIEDAPERTRRDAVIQVLAPVLLDLA